VVAIKPCSSARISLWNSQKSIKKPTKTAIFWPQNCKFSSTAGDSLKYLRSSAARKKILGRRNWRYN